MTEKMCSDCKYFQLDGMFGMWCDKDHKWLANEGNCPDYKKKYRMSEKPIGINIITSNNLPVKFYNRKTKEMEITHMIQIGDTIYVSEELFDGLKEEFEKGDVE